MPEKPLKLTAKEAEKYLLRAGFNLSVVGWVERSETQHIFFNVIKRVFYDHQ
ncbi:MAG: hypothetical protein ACKVE4_03740 [Dissulfuribacterales bacterium]